MVGKTTEGGVTMAHELYDFDSNGLARAYEDGKWALFDRAGNQVGDWYSYIEEWGEGFYKIEKGIKKNIMRPDGSVVLKAWHNDVFKVQHGFFLFSNTIRKSKTNPKTRYTYGLAHVNGDVIFPMIFNNAYWLKKGVGIYAEINDKPYILTLDGSVYDPVCGHLPKKIIIDYNTLFEKFTNWTLPGLQFFYRDTDAPVVIATTYHVGDVIRAGFFVDVTTKLYRLAHKTRFLIASAHAAMICKIGELCEKNPNIKKWNLCTLHFNSYFKVMDIYEKEGVTQVFLLHIPAAAAFILGHDETAMNFVNESTGKGTSLIDMARKSLDDKLQMKVHRRSLDREFCERMNHPVGLDDDFHPVSLDEADEPEKGAIASISKMVHELANDADIKDFYKLEDSFPYHGIKNSVCEGCIYANGMQGHGEGCGRLFIKSFRERYVKGRCEYRKTELGKPSQFEKMDKYNKQKAKDKAEKTSDVYALQTVRSFVEQYLNGDIRRLRDFDFSTIKSDERYGNIDAANAEIAKSILALVFSVSWPGLNVYAINQYEYCCSKMVTCQNLFGSSILDQYFKGMEQFCPSKEQFERALKVSHLLNSIGNMWVLPNNLNDKETMAGYKEAYKFRGYMDKYLQAMYAVFIGEKNLDMHLEGIFYKNRKMMTNYQGAEGWKNFVNDMFLESYVDDEGKPQDCFDYVWCYKKGLDRDSYFNAVDRFCTFCEKAIPERADRIIDKLETILNRADNKIVSL